MKLIQRQFLPYASGAPSLHSLVASGSRTSPVLVVTDRSVSVLRYQSSTNEYDAYELTLPMDVESEGDSFPSADHDIDVNDQLEVVCATTFASNEALHTAIAYSQSGKYGILIAKLPSDLSDLQNQPLDWQKVELEAAPTKLIATSSKQQDDTSGDAFSGILVFQSSSSEPVIGIGDIHTGESTDQFVRLNESQFASYFPFFSSFTHPVLVWDSLTMNNLPLLVLGCADGYICLLRGDMENMGTVQLVHDWQVESPVTSTSLFMSEARVNLIVASALTRAVFIQDVQDTFSTALHDLYLPPDAGFIYCAIAADFDLEGEKNILVGTESGQVLAYQKKWRKNSFEELAADWALKVIGSIYSMLWIDVDKDGIDELLIAGSTGIYIYGFTSVAVIDKVEAFLQHLIIPQQDAN